MKDQQPVRIPFGVVTGLSALILTVGGATAWWTLTNTQSQPSSTPPVAQSTASPSPADPITEEKVKIYWLQPNNAEVTLAPAAIALDPVDSSPSAILQAAIEQLLAGPADPAVTTTIPSGTKLNSLEVKPDGIHVDLSKEFTEGGGSTSMQGRVAQVLYTATSLEPGAKLWLTVDGQLLETLGGEGLLLEQPITRQAFEQNFSL